MKKILTLICLLSLPTAFAKDKPGQTSKPSQTSKPGQARSTDRKVGLVILDNFRNPEVLKIDSCEGRREQKLDYLKLNFKSDVRLNRVTVSYEDRNGGRSTGQQVISKPRKVFSKGSTFVINIQNHKCVDSIMIYGKLAKQGRYSSPSSTGLVEVYAKIK